ncbi:hypothetical protein [Geothrix alkalitolerans]|uniref:hypothetical protein n=1 Tax=Geothrix alkalitolerans TaxID=2922724 RepID=UPI001FAEE8C6|nr:hypothetical protein [Geothrix alkalitolerans]
MGKLKSRSILISLISGALSFSTALRSQSNPWPITFVHVEISSSDYKSPEVKSDPWDFEPEIFDPATAKFHLVKIQGIPSEIYKVEGTPDCSDMTIDHGGKIALPAPYSMTSYTFSCASDSSSVFEIRKNNLRHALYTHIGQAMFSPNFNKLVLYNLVKSGKDTWQRKRRIVTIESKEASSLPMIEGALYIATVTNDRVVTYGPPIRPQSNQTDPCRMVCIWNHRGALVRGLLAPMRTTLANAECSDDDIGLLPNESSTFYHLTLTGKHNCTLRLQDIHNAGAHRALNFTVPDFEYEMASVLTGIQIDLKDLTLSGGVMKYRISASGRGDISNDWGPWQTAK